LLMCDFSKHKCVILCWCQQIDHAQSFYFWDII